MLLIGGISAVYLIFLILPGAINSLETRFKTHFITRVVLLVIACYFGFLLLVIFGQQIDTCGNYVITWVDGLCKTTSTLFMFECIIIGVAGAILLLMGVSSKQQPELILVLVANLIGIIYMITSNDWLVTIIGWELFNLSLYLLVSLSSVGSNSNSNSRRSNSTNSNSDSNSNSNSLSAAMKYFLLSALVTTFMLLAVFFIYSLTGSTNYDNTSISFIMVSASNSNSNSDSNSNPNYLLMLLIVTLLWKLGAAPVHSWAPDLYDSISIPVVLWMIIIPKLAVFGLIMQIYHLNLLGTTQESYEKVFAFIGVITVLTGSIGIATQWRLVRFISYSAITHLGFLLLTITSFHVTNYLYYIAIYAITNINLFAIITDYP